MTLKKMLTEIDEKKPVVWFVEKFNLCEQNEISEKKWMFGASIVSFYFSFKLTECSCFASA